MRVLGFIEERSGRERYLYGWKNNMCLCIGASEPVGGLPGDTKLGNSKIGRRMELKAQTQNHRLS